MRGRRGRHERRCCGAVPTHTVKRVPRPLTVRRMAWWCRESLAGDGTVASATRQKKKHNETYFFFLSHVMFLNLNEYLQRCTSKFSFALSILYQNNPETKSYDQVGKINCSDMHALHEVHFKIEVQKTNRAFYIRQGRVLTTRTRTQAHPPCRNWSRWPAGGAGRTSLSTQPTLTASVPSGAKRRDAARPCKQACKLFTSARTAPAPASSCCRA